MRDGGQNMVGDKIGGGLDLALVAGRAKPAAFAGEGQEVLPAQLARHSGVLSDPAKSVNSED